VIAGFARHIVVHCFANLEAVAVGLHKPGQPREAAVGSHNPERVVVVDHSQAHFDHKEAAMVDYSQTHCDHKEGVVDHAPARFAHKPKVVGCSPARFVHKEVVGHNPIHFARHKFVVDPGSFHVAHKGAAADRNRGYFDRMMEVVGRNHRAYFGQMQRLPNQAVLVYLHDVLKVLAHRLPKR